MLPLKHSQSVRSWNTIMRETITELDSKLQTTTEGIYMYEEENGTGYGKFMERDL